MPTYQLNIMRHPKIVDVMTLTIYLLLISECKSDYDDVGVGSK